MDDSSPDLSLKLRRGSSDSRDSFYMDLDKGIDSDIEDMGTTTTSTGVETKETTANPTPAATVLGIVKEESMRYVSADA
ncbi:hypothetical protein QE152_g15416 [Popillia japonica]|uniref:Uncharacterized protein n=1 Tax=Popillia japonica TaxID=7064 RepID=A0AAW1L825_POPJA